MSRMDRRLFIHTAASLSGLAAVSALPGGSLLRRWSPAVDPFTLGIASGDPAPDGVVLWTRLAPDPFVPGGGLAGERVPVRWEVATDDGFRQVVQRGEVVADERLAHSVHVEVAGLRPSSTYFYRFHAGGATSATGRTRTTPRDDEAVAQLDFAFASCQKYEQGYYTAQRHLAAEDVSLVLFLGDYIYEDGPHDDTPRRHDGPMVTTLAAYRNRYALYKRDADLQAAHLAAPWVVTWDDHEVANNYANDHDAVGTDPAEVLTRRAAAYQAYYEHMPLRSSSMPSGSSLRLYRRLRFGRLAEFHLLDTRQYRTDQPCGDGTRVPCAAAADPGATILGAEQGRWLRSGLRASRGRWNVLGNQVPIATTSRPTTGGLAQNLDHWAGYTHERDALTRFLHDARVRNPVFLTGDVHVSWAADVRTDYAHDRGVVVGTEFVGTSLSSGGNGVDLGRAGEQMLANNPHVSFYNGQRGYVRCRVTEKEMVAAYRVVPFVSQPGAPVVTRTRLTVKDGVPGVQR